MKNLTTKITAILLAICILMGTTVTTLAANDSWYYTTAQQISLTVVGQDRSATRYEVGSLMLRIYETKRNVTLKLDDTSSLNKYSDLNNIPSNQIKDWAVLDAKAIINGRPNGNAFYIQPNDLVLRSELAKILYKTHENWNLFNANARQNPNFSDVVGNSKWAETYINWAYSAQLINGTSSSTFNPTGNVSIMELMAIVNNLRSSGVLTLEGAQNVLLTVFPGVFSKKSIIVDEIPNGDNNNGNNNNGNNNNGNTTAPVSFGIDIDSQNGRFTFDGSPIYVSVPESNLDSSTRIFTYVKVYITSSTVPSVNVDMTNGRGYGDAHWTSNGQYVDNQKKLTPQKVGDNLYLFEGRFLSAFAEPNSMTYINVSGTSVNNGQTTTSDRTLTFDCHWQ